MRIKKAIFIPAFISILLFLYWLPLIFIQLINSRNIIESIDLLPESDAVIIFGTIVGNDRKITPLLRERLEAGVDIIKKGKSRKIVVSNMTAATKVMAGYLKRRNIPLSTVELDTQAHNTPDTCRFEKKRHPENRKVIFISQGFHLPRILYQCSKAGVEGVAFPAENVGLIGISNDSFHIRIAVKVYRYIREAGLTWLAILGIYK